MKEIEEAMKVERKELEEVKDSWVEDSDENEEDKFVQPADTEDEYSEKFYNDDINYYTDTEESACRRN